MRVSCMTVSAARAGFSDRGISPMRSPWLSASENWMSGWLYGNLTGDDVALPKVVDEAEVLPPRSNAQMFGM